MKRSTFPNRDQNRLHVAVIMDGNGRWAEARGLQRLEGHRSGVGAVHRTVKAALSLGISRLTLFALSSDNRRRPAAEVDGLFEVLERFLLGQATTWAQDQIRVSFLGRRDRLPDSLRRTMESAEQKTGGAERLHLRIAIDYSARESILRAARKLPSRGDVTPQSFDRLLDEGASSGPSGVDLLIRTGGERRLSDFLLWECAYAELYFTDRMWPDFTGSDLALALREFEGRERRFGELPRRAAG